MHDRRSTRIAPAPGGHLLPLLAGAWFCALLTGALAIALGLGWLGALGGYMIGGSAGLLGLAHGVALRRAPVRVRPLRFRRAF